MENKELLLDGNIVVIGRSDKSEVVARLTKELLVPAFIGCVQRGDMTVRVATTIEKQYWFEGYDQEDISILPLKHMTHWAMCKIANRDE